jgi:acetyltransferase-like isoleucine patch superfamily enzyme
VAIFEFVNLYGCEIGDGSRIGTFVEIQRNAVIGRRVRVQSHTFICAGVRIEDDVFIGHNVTFINDRHPSAEGARTGRWTLEPTLVKRGASIGSGAVILCGLTIGEGARIGAGAVVTHDVSAFEQVAGVPARALVRRPR